MEKQYENIIIGIDPGTNVMGYALLGVNGKKPELIVMGVLRLNRMEDHYMRLRHIYERVSGVIAEYLPDEMAIEAPFYGKNVQSMLKLGRAQGVAMVAALNREIPITEYEPRKIKMAITGNGAASKEQVALIVEKTLGIDIRSKYLDATDALAIDMCHYYQISSPLAAKASGGSWERFIANNPDRVKP